MDPHCLKKLNSARSARQGAVLVTSLADGRDRVVLEGDPTTGELGEAVARTFASNAARSVVIDGQEFFINPFLPEPLIVMIGAVHITQVLVPMARLAGFNVQVIDPRTAFATPERFPDVNLLAEWPDDVLARQPLDKWCALVAVTHDPKIDDGPLKAALDAECFYVGALGSRKTHARRVERLSEAGYSQEAISRIRAPIGLDIGASGPAEIAVSILAEIIRHLRMPATTS